MNLIWLVLAGIAVWALVRLGRQTEARGRGHWRVTATLFSSVMMAGAALMAFRQSWIAAAALAGAGLWLTIASRQRTLPPRGEAMSLAEARSVLGVAADAGTAEITAAWKRLMARAHPDQGGTDGLASRLNAARDRLLGK